MRHFLSFFFTIENRFPSNNTSRSQFLLPPLFPHSIPPLIFLKSILLLSPFRKMQASKGKQPNTKLSKIQKEKKSSHIEVGQSNQKKEKSPRSAASLS